MEDVGPIKIELPLPLKIIIYQLACPGGISRE